MKKSVVHTFLNQHYRHSSLKPYENISNSSLKIQQIEKSTRTLSRSSKKIEGKNQAQEQRSSHLLISFLFNIIWKKLTCPLIELITPSILRINHLRNVTDYRIHNGSSQESGMLTIENESSLSCHEKPTILHIRGKEIQNCVIKDPFDVFECIKKPNHKSRGQIQNQGSEKTAKNESLKKSLNGVVKNVDHKISNVVPSIENEKHLLHLGDLRQYNDGFELGFEIRESQTISGSILPSLGPLQNNKPEEVVEQKKVDNESLTNVILSTKNNKQIVNLNPESEKSSFAANNNLPINNLNLVANKNKRITKKSVRRRNISLQGKLNENSDLFSGKEGKTLEKSHDIPYETVIDKSKTQKQEQTNQSLKDSSSKKCLILDNELNSKYSKKNLSNRGKLLILDKVDQQTIKTGALKNVGQTNIDKNVNSSTTYNGNKIQKLIAVTDQNKRGTNQPISYLSQDVINVKDFCNQPKNETSKNLHVSNVKNTDNVIKKLDDNPKPHNLKNENQSHFAKKMELEIKNYSISSSTNEDKCQLHQNKYASIENNYKAVDPTNVLNKNNSASHKKSVKSFKKVISAEKDSLGESKSDNNVSDKQMDVNCSLVQENKIDEQKSTSVITQPYNSRVDRFIRVKNEINSKVQPMNKKRQDSCFANRGSLQSCKNSNSHIIKTNLVRFDTTDEEACILVRQQNIGAGVKSDLVDLKTVIFEESLPKIKSSTEQNLKLKPFKEEINEYTNNNNNSKSKESYEKTLIKPWKKEVKVEPVETKENPAKFDLKMKNWSCKVNKFNFKESENTPYLKSNLTQPENQSQNLVQKQQNKKLNLEKVQINKNEFHDPKSIRDYTSLKPLKSQLVSQESDLENKKSKIEINEPLSVKEVTILIDSKNNITNHNCHLKENFESESNKKVTAVGTFSGKEKQPSNSNLVEVPVSSSLKENKETTIREVKPKASNHNSSKPSYFVKEKDFPTTKTSNNFDTSSSKLKSEADRLSKEYIKNENDFKTKMIWPNTKTPFDTTFNVKESFSESSLIKKQSKSHQELLMTEKSGKRYLKAALNNSFENNNEKQKKQSEKYLSSEKKEHEQKAIPNNELTGVHVSKSLNSIKEKLKTVEVVNMQNVAAVHSAFPQTLEQSRNGSKQTNNVSVKVKEFEDAFIGRNRTLNRGNSNEYLNSNSAINANVIKNKDYVETLQIQPDIENPALSRMKMSKDIYNKVKDKKTSLYGKPTPSNNSDILPKVNVDSTNLKQTEKRKDELKSTNQIKAISGGKMIKNAHLESKNPIGKNRVLKDINNQQDFKMVEKPLPKLDFESSNTSMKEDTRQNDKVIKDMNIKIANFKHKLTITGHKQKWKNQTPKSQETLVGSNGLKHVKIETKNIHAKSYETIKMQYSVLSKKSCKDKNQELALQSGFPKKETASKNNRNLSNSNEHPTRDTLKGTFKLNTEQSSSKPLTSVRPALNIPKSVRSFENIKHKERITQNRNIAKLVPPLRSKSALTNNIQNTTPSIASSDYNLLKKEKLVLDTNDKSKPSFQTDKTQINKTHHNKKTGKVVDKIGASDTKTKIQAGQ